MACHQQACHKTAISDCIVGCMQVLKQWFPVEPDGSLWLHSIGCDRDGRDRDPTNVTLDKLNPSNRQSQPIQCRAFLTRQWFLQVDCKPSKTVLAEPRHAKVVPTPSDLTGYDLSTHVMHCQPTPYTPVRNQTAVCMSSLSTGPYVPAGVATVLPKVLIGTASGKTHVVGAPMAWL